MPVNARDFAEFRLQLGDLRRLVPDTHRAARRMLSDAFVTLLHDDDKSLDLADAQMLQAQCATPHDIADAVAELRRALDRLRASTVYDSCAEADRISERTQARLLGAKR
jgi:hypothetical protein